MLIDGGIDPAGKDARGHNALLFAASSDTVTPQVFGLLLTRAAPDKNERDHGKSCDEASRNLTTDAQR